jgi:hypothetical protein
MPVSASPNAVIVAELVSPGFADDLSTWVFTVDATGAATQEVVLANSQNRYSGETCMFKGGLAPAEISEILDAAINGGFARLAAEYSSSIDDTPITALSFRIGDELKRVQAYGAGWLAHKGNEQMKLFVDLWRRIARHLPYRGA